MDKQQARRIVETLRAGVPSREVSSVLMEGQRSVLNRARADLIRAADGGSASLILSGQYGEGKSHLLSAIDNIAREQGFAVSSIVLSKETPLSRINKVYEAAAHAVTGEGLSRAGFEDILRRLHPSADETIDVAQYTEKNLHPKISYVFQNYLEEGAILTLAQLYDDLAGASMTMSDLRAIHRRHFHEAMRMPRRFLIQQDTPDYFRFLSFLLRRVGYKGWVILMDEAELIAKLGIGSRAQAYVNLAILLGLHRSQSPLAGVYVVLALARPFVQEVLLDRNDRYEGRGDLKRVPQWLTDPRRNRAEDKAPAEAVMQSLEHSISLEPLTEANIEAILTRIEECHNLAYRWDGKLDRQLVKDRARAQASNPTRTTIRAALEYLDLFYQYGQPPDIEVRAPDTDWLKEDASFEDAASGTEES